MYPLYKANRPPSPPEIKEAIPVMTRLSREMGLKVISPPGIEADDAIGTLTRRALREVRVARGAARVTLPN